MPATPPRRRSNQRSSQRPLQIRIDVPTCVYVLRYGHFIFEMSTGDLRNVDRRMLPEFGRRASAISAGNLAVSAHRPQIADISVNGGRAPMTFNFRSAATFGVP